MTSARKTVSEGSPQSRRELEAALGPFMGVGMSLVCGFAVLGGWVTASWPLVLVLCGISVLTVQILHAIERRRGERELVERVAAVVHLTTSGACVLLTGGLASPLWMLFLIAGLIAGLTDTSGCRWSVRACAVAAGVTL